MDAKRSANPHHTYGLWRRASELLVFLAATLAGLSFAFFRWRAGSGFEPVLRENAARDPGWVAYPSTAYQSPLSLQNAAGSALSAVLVTLLACGVAVAAIAVLTLILTHYSSRRSEFATRAALGASPARNTFEFAVPIARVCAYSGFGAALSAML